MTAPTTYHRCMLAMETDGFIVCGPGSQDPVEVSSDIEARAVASIRWPGASYVLTTFRCVFGRFADGEAADVVIMAVCTKAGDTSERAILGYILGSVHGPFCVPFTPEVWQDAIDKLTR